MSKVKTTPVIDAYRHSLLFYGLSVAIPWLFWFAAGYVSYLTPYQEKYLNWASILAFAGLLAPMLVSFALIFRNPELKKDVAGRFFNFRDIKPVYLILSCFLMPGSILLAQAVSLWFGYDAAQFTVTGEFTFSSGIFPVWFLLIIAPVIEELAWHSYGTDCLRRKFNLFKTSLLFGALWGIWHMPLSSIRDYYQNNLLETGWIHSVNFLVSIIPYVLIMNWLYYKTGRNIIVTIIFHITAGFFNEIFATHPDSKVIQTMLLSIFAAIVVIREKKLFFSHN